MIRISKCCGCCMGSKRAIDMAIDLAKKDKKVYVYKEILHNQNVINYLLKNGIVCIDDLSVVKDEVVVLRAHGEGKETYDYLKSHNIEYYDATCVNVVRIHEIINKKYSEGYSIIIIGKNNHPEVVGSNGWCNNDASIVSCSDDIEKLDISNKNIFVICQTTFNKQLAIEFINNLKEKYKDRNIEVVDSICNASINIQNKSKELAKISDLMIVIGGKNSSNTKELYNVCNEVCSSYLVSNKKELVELLSNLDINKDTNIGITAGASTMLEEIDEYKNMIDFYIDYKDVVKKVIEYQKKFNSEMINCEDNSIINDSVKQLIRLNSDGKYIRAYLISLAYRIYGKNDDCYLPLAALYELFQTSILIHDDVIDNADIRRNKETIPIYYQKKYDLDNKKLGNDIAICVGDYGFYYADKILIDNYSTNPNFINVFREFNNIVLNTIRGEILDVELPYSSKSNNIKIEEDVLKIYSLKTSWYSILGPFRLGMLLAGSNDSKYDEILHDLGISYQIRDDILGIFGENDKVGKTASDISEFKQTLLYSYVNDNDKYKKELLKYYGKSDLTANEIEKVKNIFIESGALDYAKEKENKFFVEIISKIGKIDIDIRYRSVLLGLVSYLMLRSK